MQSKLLIGRTIDTGSWVHSLDPRAKLTAMLLYAAAIIVLRSWTALAVTAIFSILFMLATRIPIKYYVKAARPLWILMLFILVVQCITVREGEVWFRVGSWPIYIEGISQGALSAARMALLVSFTALLTFTTTPGKLNQGLEGMLKPLKRIGISSERLTLMMSIALRFIPTILEETNKIMKAQAARGADLRDLPWKEKGRLLISLLVPVTVGAFRRAEELVVSMEARGYVVGEPRSEYHILRWSLRDTGFTMLYVLLVIAVIWL